MGVDEQFAGDGDQDDLGGECEKPGALRCELDCLLAEASVQHRGPDLKHAMGAAR